MVRRLTRLRSPNPYDHLPPLPSFTLTSDDLTPDGTLAPEQVYPSHGGANVSPHLQWSGYPIETQSFAVTCFDPDAPTGSGWWHWIVVDIPSNVTELAAGASGNETLLPHTAVEMRNDYGSYGYGGAAPPAGDMAHRYFWAVHALDIAKLGLPPEATPAVVASTLTAHSTARAVLMTTYQY